MNETGMLTWSADTAVGRWRMGTHELVLAARKGECVSEEQQGGGAETLSRIEVEHGNYPIYASAGYPKKWTI